VVEFISIIGTVLAVLGTVLNNRRRRACFWVWMACNLLTLPVHVYAGLWSLAARDVLFFILAVDGLIRWSKKERREVTP
jgi:nicotinamide riboside transporter PnuC